MGYKDNVRYSRLSEDAQAFSDLDIVDLPPRKRRSKSISIILTVACIIALGLGASFYQATKRDLMSELMSGSNVDIHKALRKAYIIPDIIPDFTPSFGLAVSWPSTSYQATLGNKLKPKNLQSAPEVYLTNPPHTTPTSSIGAHHSLPINNIVITMTDPDAPSRKDPKWGQVCHWIAAGVPFVNISSSPSFSPSAFSLAALSATHKAKTLKPVMPYKPPGPPPKTGKHRYILLAFMPRNATSLPLQLVQPGDRRHWGTGEVGAGVSGWAEEMGLQPIAANFFYAKNDEQ